MRSSQETILKAAELQEKGTETPAGKGNRLDSFFMESHDELAVTRGREGGGGLPTTICTVYIMCVSGSDVQCVTSGLHVFLCKGEKRQLADSDADQRNRAGGMKSDRNFQGNDG